MSEAKLHLYENVCTCGLSFEFRDQLAIHLNTPGHALAITVFTLDSHDTFGPFETMNDAARFARERNLTSYTIRS